MTQPHVPEGYQAIKSKAAFFLPDTGRFRLVGPEAQEYLHRMVTNDIRTLTLGEGTYACLLDINGRMIADLWAWILAPDQILVETAATACDAAMEALNKYLIMEEVEIQDARADESLVSVQGPSALDGLANALALDLPDLEPGTVWQSADNGTGLVVAARDRTGHGGLDVYTPNGSEILVAALRDTGMPEASGEAVETLRIEAGIPIWGAELTTSTIPLEANLVGSAVSFTKGCYPGQEIIARIHSRGKPAKHLVGIRFESGPPPAGSAVLSGGATVGVLTSATNSPTRGPIALAYLKKEFGEPGIAVVCEEIAGQTVAGS